MVLILLISRLFTARILQVNKTVDRGKQLWQTWAGKLCFLCSDGLSRKFVYSHYQLLNPSIQDTLYHLEPQVSNSQRSYQYMPLNSHHYYIR